jgi:hypothetical protein
MAENDDPTSVQGKPLVGVLGATVALVPAIAAMGLLLKSYDYTGSAYSTIAKMSKETAGALDMCARLCVPAVAAAVMWTVSALVASDTPVNNAIGAWEAIGDAANRLLPGSVETVAGDLASWQGGAADAGRAKLKELQDTVNELGARAEKIANGLFNVVGDLNKLYAFAFVFVAGQAAFFAALGGLSLVWPPAAAVLNAISSTVALWVVGFVNLLGIAASAIAMYVEIGHGASAPTPDMAVNG